jgi:hypothetical protein
MDHRHAQPLVRSRQRLHSKRLIERGRRARLDERGLILRICSLTRLDPIANVPRDHVKFLRQHPNIPALSRVADRTPSQRLKRIPSPSIRDVGHLHGKSAYGEQHRAALRLREGPDTHHKFRRHARQRLTHANPPTVRPTSSPLSQPVSTHDAARPTRRNGHAPALPDTVWVG